MASKHTAFAPLPRDNLRYDPLSGRYRIVHEIQDRRLHRLTALCLILGSAGLMVLLITGMFTHG